MFLPLMGFSFIFRALYSYKVIFSIYFIYMSSHIKSNKNFVFG